MVVAFKAKKKKNPVQVPREKALKLAYAAANCKTEWEGIEAIEQTIQGLPEKSDWVRYGRGVIAYLKGETDTPPVQIIKSDGNRKLPFYTWSVVPLYTCPGKGACSKFCYSLRGWRFAPALLRQVMNTILFRFRREVIERAFQALPQGTTVRLFVDGDFDSLESVQWWFDQIRRRPDLKVYGYSKSWDELYAYNGVWPDNYQLNLSSGGRVRTITKEQMATLPITRGEFVAVKIDRKLIKVGEGRYALPEYHKAVRDAAKAAGFSKALSCPGNCGGCVKNTDGSNLHACGGGRPGLIGLPIAIGIH